MKTFFCFAALVLSISLSSIASAQLIVPVSATADVRLLTSGTGAPDVNNGGNTASGRIIGVNTGGIDNFMVYPFAPADLSALAGQTINGATVSFSAVDSGNANHGNASDTINLLELALPNAGWVVGNGIQTGNVTTNPDDGSISYANRVQYDTSGTTEPWLDAGSNAVANILAASTSVATAPGYLNNSNGGSLPGALSFNVSAADAQSWVDNGLAGLVLSSTDGGDSRGRFFFAGAAPVISFDVVPEPAGLILLFGALLPLMMLVRKRS